MKAEEDRLHVVAQLALLRELLVNPEFPTSAANWAIRAIDAFVSGEVDSLDKAFGLIRDGRKGRPKDDLRHAHHATEMWFRYMDAMAARDGRTETAICAALGREFGLGGVDAEAEGDSAVASEFKRLIDTYRQLIVKQVSALVAAKLEVKDVEIAK
jgi:hypothetical protein